MPSPVPHASSSGAGTASAAVTVGTDAVPPFVYYVVRRLFSPEDLQVIGRRWTMIAAFIGLQIFATYVVILPLYLWAIPDAFPWMPMVLPFSLVGVGLARAGHLRAAETAITGTLFTLYMITIYASGGAHSPATVLLATVPSIPLSLRRDNAVLAWAAVAILAAASLNVPPIAAFMSQGVANPAAAPYLLPWFVCVATMVATTSVLQVASASLRLTGQLEQAVQELRATARAAEAANDAKGVFLASMTHEIRTPMNGVLGIARVLARTRLDPEQREYVGTLDESASALMAILDDVLDFSRIEAGALHLRSAPFKPAEVVRSVTTLLSMAASEKGIKILVDMGDTPEWVAGDAPRLRQLLVNLIGNAVRYTQRGFIRVTSHTLSDAAPGQVRLGWEVRDSGAGIPPERIAEVFDRFTRGPETTDAYLPGTGLGLSIAQGIVQAMGGRLTVTSEVGVGSTFSFDLTLGGAQPNTHAAPALEVPPPVGTVRALVVEDNPVNVLVARAMLQKLGCEVEVATNGVLALEAAAKRRFDIIFMDCAMPLMDGYQATRALRNTLGATPITVPIVAMTADVLPSTQQACSLAGMTRFVAKPTTMNTLRDVIRRLCHVDVRPPDASMEQRTELLH
jgi:signal transduction histidine kinase